MKRLLLVLLLLMAPVGCSTVQTKDSQVEGRQIDRNLVTMIKPGRTTKTSILAAFGEPTRVDQTEDGEKLVYEYRKKVVSNYFGGLVTNEISGKEEATVLEVDITGGVVQHFSFKSTEK